MWVYVDSAALIALGNRRDNLHHRAVAVYAELLEHDGKFLTSNAVLLEVMNTFSQTSMQSMALTLLDMIDRSRHWRSIMIDDALWSRGVERFGSRMDKDWSLVDCLSMVLAETHEIQRIFTSDHHFEQAGFSILLGNA